MTELSVNATTCAHHQCNCCRRMVPTHSTCTMHMLPMMLPKVSGLIHDTSRPVCAMSKVCSIPFICQLKQACMAHIYIMYSISYRIHHGYCYKCYVCFLRRILPTQCCSKIIPIYQAYIVRWAWNKLVVAQVRCLIYSAVTVLLHDEHIYGASLPSILCCWSFLVLSGLFGSLISLFVEDY